MKTINNFRWSRSQAIASAEMMGLNPYDESVDFVEYIAALFRAVYPGYNVTVHEECEENRVEGYEVTIQLED